MKKNIEKEYKLYPEVNSVYKHYKGGKYKVLTLAKHSETQEDIVVYKSLHFGSFHVRPLSMWFDVVIEDDDVSDDMRVRINKGHFGPIRRFTLIK